MHNRLTAFLVPIIKSDPDNKASIKRIKGDLTINQRLNLTKVVILSTEEMERDFKGSSEVAHIKKNMVEILDQLLLQSEVENMMLKSLKISTNKLFQDSTKEKIKEINRCVYTPDTLIENFTKNMGMHKYSLKALKLLVTQNGLRAVTHDIKEQIIHYYREIISYTMKKLQSTYPQKCYEELQECASLFYNINEKTDARSLMARNHQDSLRTAFFPANDILEFVLNANDMYYGSEADSCHYIDKVIKSKSKDDIINTPYWFVGLLFEVNQETPSFIIDVLFENYTKANTISSMINLIVGIRLYINRIMDAQQAQLRYYENDILTDYNPLKINEIVDRVKVSYHPYSLPYSLFIFIEKVRLIRPINLYKKRYL